MIKRKLGSFLFFSGLISLIYTGINYINNAESFGFIGIESIAGKGEVTPVIVSAGIMLLGLMFSSVRR